MSDLAMQAMDSTHPMHVNVPRVSVTVTSVGKLAVTIPQEEEV
ncbi:hypothetical protein [Acidipropionibacterium virtanenii]|uniref:Uncharacterized protein n=1 Tax=Acidipropionibacterium virtanenii TaxID=2057246 RepID=A0A344UTE3_9ACTN|nr:hypothetical protein [Acidipropionibacterium virtanenii]AXE38541.1 hypothetical protein JS278_01366 [Acidipropionibacterium virtanenii]